MTKAHIFARYKFIWNKNFTYCLKIIGSIWVDFFLSVYLEETTIRQRFSTNLLASIITKRQHEIYPINQTVIAKTRIYQVWPMESRCSWPRERSWKHSQMWPHYLWQKLTSNYNKIQIVYLRSPV